MLSTTLSDAETSKEQEEGKSRSLLASSAFMKKIDIVETRHISKIRLM